MGTLPEETIPTEKINKAKAEDKVGISPII